MKLRSPLRQALPAVILLALACAGARGEESPSWVAPMKKVRARFTGKPGTLAAFGDSITVTMALWAPLRAAQRAPGQVQTVRPGGPAHRPRQEGAADRLPGGDPQTPAQRLGRRVAQVQGRARQRIRGADADRSRRRPPVQSAGLPGLLGEK